LASHVAIFIAMFISPSVAIAVAIGTAIGFLLGGFPLMIVLRAASHIVFVTVGTFYLHKISKINLLGIRLIMFSLIIAIIHAAGEVIVVSIFYFDGNISDAYRNQGFFTSVILLIGLGTIIHSMVDFFIARIIILPLKKQRGIEVLFNRC